MHEVEEGSTLSSQRRTKQALGFFSSSLLTTSSLKPSFGEGTVLGHTGIHRITQEQGGILPTSSLWIVHVLPTNLEGNGPPGFSFTIPLLLMAREETQAPPQSHPLTRKVSRKSHMTQSRRSLRAECTVVQVVYYTRTPNPRGELFTGQISLLLWIFVLCYTFVHFKDRQFISFSLQFPRKWQ